MLDHAPDVYGFRDVFELSTDKPFELDTAAEDTKSESKAEAEPESASEAGAEKPFPASEAASASDVSA